MWKWIALTSLVVLALEAALSSRQAVVARDQAPEANVPLHTATTAMERIKERDLQGALAILGGLEGKKYPAEVLAAQAENGSRQIAKQLAVIDGLGESLHDVELIGSEIIGKSYITFNFLERFERRGLVWKMTFYRAKDGWFMSNLEWTQDLRSYFKPSPSELRESL